ncbi:MAG: hypothetical protein NZ942_00635 [Candidatus Aenigmarchaeota archaeon]|nr:hypothetical protein [Candidatus Aenigmarchaeota archaeon]
MSKIICSKCGSSYVVISSATYPNSFECKKCGNLFLKIPKTLVDE